jgi:hypothetical protein
MLAADVNCTNAPFSSAVDRIKHACHGPHLRSQQKARYCHIHRVQLPRRMRPTLNGIAKLHSTSRPHLRGQLQRFVMPNLEIAALSTELRVFSLPDREWRLPLRRPSNLCCSLNRPQSFAIVGKCTAAAAVRTAGY